MVKRTILAAIVAFSVVTADENTMSDSQVKECYYSSYELEKQARYSEAGKALADVIKHYPNGYTVNYRMGWLSYLNGKYADAMSYYNKALAIYPSSVEVLQSIVLIGVARNDWVRVEDQVKKILKIDYYNQTANYWYSYALREQGLYKESVQVMERMTYLYPTSTSYLIEYGKSQFALKEYESALQLFNSVLILDPYNQDAVEYLKKLEKR